LFLTSGHKWPGCSKRSCISRPSQAWPGRAEKPASTHPHTRQVRTLKLYQAISRLCCLMSHRCSDSMPVLPVAATESPVRCWSVRCWSVRCSSEWHRPVCSGLVAALQPAGLQAAARPALAQPVR